MIGIYLHIPFCKTKCSYCDFYSTASQALVQPTVLAMQEEMSRRKNYFALAKKVSFDWPKSTLYVGGGTPSLLPAEMLAALSQTAQAAFGAAPPEEFTVELNPDDATPAYMQQLRGMGVNRISIGIQSFFDDDLRRLRRRHSAQQAVRSVQLAQEAGFGNISVDLIYGLPQMDAERWRRNLNAAFSLGVPHLSAYALTIEPRTPFGALRRKNRLPTPSDDEVAMQYDLLCLLCAEQGLEHYEISSFARSGFFSQHNAAYWQQQPYIGIGPAAHSYSGRQRQCNVASCELYIKKVSAGEDFFETENLSSECCYNEYVLTGLRTAWGVSKSYLQKTFDKKLTAYFFAALDKHIENKNITVDGDRIAIPENRWFVADSIIVDLIWA
ncbi:MAG: radical SAM family heme chaperone HemW [Prevotellaceae bacterium]|jgi:oxygen-independent coproporphyrinogen-3 oxidase|nr:radical SAM family heme chaperone HemW [Prevotellaceae bacterium]